MTVNLEKDESDNSSKKDNFDIDSDNIESQDLLEIISDEANEKLADTEEEYEEAKLDTEDSRAMVVMSQKDVEETRKVNTHESSEENRYQLLQAMAAKNEITEQLSRAKMSKKQCKANLNYREQRHIPDEIKYGKYERKSGSQTGTSAGAGVDVAPVAPTRMGGGSKLK